MAPIQPRPHHDAVKALCREMLGLIAPSEEDDAIYSRRDEIESFYDRIFDYHQEKPPGDHAERIMGQAIDVQKPGLNPTLRPYQIAAVKWMMERERGLLVADSEIRQKNDVLFDHVLTHDKKTLAYNRWAGTFHLEKPELPPLPYGGILADEMGLGKTVEMLALIMSHPCPPIEPDEPLPIIEPKDEAMEIEKGSTSKQEGMAQKKGRPKKAAQRKAPARIAEENEDGDEADGNDGKEEEEEE